MTDRKQFIESMKAQLDNIDEKISTYEKKMAEANERAASEYADRLDELRNIRADAAESLTEARDKADSEWAEFRDNAERRWNKITEASSDAFARLREGFTG
ncbi:hypothetical protein LNKW23_38570 [Paralimibaculum aggregatum]|uniref:Coiled coil domain-containing protein n=1 Tax=Paralimibaculum aggregatum TaxID=3036245 RepID=A0ABQ6LPU7_9RHOB|nr:hypothetical protein [Limibaculum sp. NKW23]GMG84641.1 hypothetical protein LNKW23_38570 [Limibaculum sp. NKW23]